MTEPLTNASSDPADADAAARAAAGSTTTPAASDELILVLNCGSSSIKFALFDGAARGAPLSRDPLWSGRIQGIGGPDPTFVARARGTSAAASPERVMLGDRHPRHDALTGIRERIAAHLDERRIRTVAHRVVHGGSKYFVPSLVNPTVLKDLRSYIPLAPLHQPFALDAIEELLSARPDLPQVACFDTGFHRTLPLVEQMLPLPHATWDRGLRRYGFHGLSYEYLSIVLPERFGAIAHGRVIAAHLGSGASLCALRNLRSVATTMGFSALDGLMMGTRCGAVDPGALIYLMEIERLSLEQVGDMLYHQSGLLGVSGLSPDPPVLLAHERRDDEVGERARAALALYVRRLLREIGAQVAVLGGLDLLVFTAGIGEHSTEIRARVCRELTFLGVRLDEAANEANGSVISAAESRVVVAVEPTNEEWIAARQAAEVAA